MRGSRKEKRAMARPKLQDDERMSEVVRLRMTTAELNHVRTQADAAGTSVSDFLRKRAMGYVVPSSGSSRRVDPALITEINRVGVNVNQLALATHTGRDFVRYWQEIGREVEQVLDRVLEQQAGET